MIRVSETKDRFEVRAERLSALLRDAGVSEHGPRTARPTFHRSWVRHRPDNMVIDWLRSKSQSLREYHEYLHRFDLSLRRSLGRVERESDGLLRLALALFVDFAHAQGLDAVEMAALMHDVQSEVLEAIEYLLTHSKDDAGAAGDRDEETDEAWGDAPSLAC